MTAPGRRATRRLALIAVGLLAVAPARAGEGPARPGPAHHRAERVHLVRPGETLAQIARRNAVTVGALVAANRLAGPRARLRVGQRLVIPVAHGRARPAARAVPRLPANIVLAIPDFDGRAPLFEWPVDGAVASDFGRRRSGWHRGLDIKADMGTPVLAAAPGVVIASDLEPRYGNVVKIEHENDFVTVYAHHLQNFVEVGDRVEAGQVIGQVGRTGRATAYHLHFEIRHAGSVYDPLYLLPAPSRLTAVDGDGSEDDTDDE